MANEDEKKVDEIDAEGDEQLGEDPTDDDTTDWKAEAKKARGIATRYRTKLVKATEKKKTEPPAAAPATENKGFDYGELAYIASKGISDDEIPFVEQTVKETGKSLRELLATNWFQAELKEKRDEKAAKDAIPTGSKRSSNATRDTVEYWVAKGGLPEDPILARKVVNARSKAETDKSKFSDRPVV